MFPPPIIEVIFALIVYSQTVFGPEVPALPQRYPYLVKVRSVSEMYSCGGVLITPSIVLTVAHCVNGKNSTKMQIVPAISNNNKQQGHLTTLSMSVKGVVLYETFKSHTLENDLALVVLTAEWHLTNGSYSVTIPNGTTTFKENATFIAWTDRKATLNGTSLEPVLHTTNVSMISKEACATKANASISDKQLCAEALGNGSCTSGWSGHLECTGEGEATFLCGIYSWGSGCGSLPAVFTNIGWYRTWIQSIVERSYKYAPAKGNNNTEKVASAGCAAHLFECNITKKCIKSYYVCDGEHDCGGNDSSDEDGCRAINGCHASQFACRGGNRCLPAHQRCDGHTNCNDLSDEENCEGENRTRSCMSNHFKCNATKICVKQEYLCDGIQNCGKADLSDEQNCRAANGCHPYQFSCRLGNKCIPQYKRCDNIVHCLDKSDEDNCDRRNVNACNLRTLPCSIYSKCYSLLEICDGKRNCGKKDLSDEINCKKGVHGCPWTHFSCRNGKCVRGTSRCDGKQDCKDGSDEENCNDARSCHWTQFECRNGGRCITKSDRCDGQNNCEDGSDEKNCDDPNSCHWSQFACLDRSACLPGHFKCDGVVQCNDGSDEKMCGRNKTGNCKPSQIECTKVPGRCFTMEDICDVHKHCGLNDISDETHCAVGINGCHWRKFECRTEKHCISAYKRCNGERDCQDGSDEENCEGPNRCHWAQFACRNSSKCIPGKYRCDGYHDCNDGDDEENCNDPTRCHWTEFRCADKSKCLPGYLKCDGKHHCNDRSDEEDCGDHPSGTKTAIETLSGYFAIPSCLVVLLAVVLLVIYRRYRRQMGRLSAMEIRLFEKGDEKQLNDNNFAHENAQFLPYNRTYEIKWKDFKFSDGDKLGEGAYGIVFKGHWVGKPADTVAVKTVKGKVEKAVLLALLSELKVMIHLGKHENIAELLGACTEFLREGRAYMLMEYCPMGSLESYLRELDKGLGAERGKTLEGTNGMYEEQKQSDALLWSGNDLVSWAVQISRGMQHLQHKKVIHGDLATRNVLLFSKNQVKITDFGLSRQLANYDTNYVKKTQAMLPWRWLALETLKSMVFTHKSDVWAYGVTLWEIFSLGQVPYAGLGWTADFVGFLEQGQRLSKPKLASNEMYKIMMHCWESEPDMRPDFKQIEVLLRRDVAGLPTPTTPSVTMINA